MILRETPIRTRRPSWRGPLALCLTLLVAPATLRAEPSSREESVEQALCRMIEGAATKAQVPVAIFTRLLWQESSFRPNVTSPAGAQGMAQFMPGTARERGLDDPFDPEQAIPASAAFLADLTQRFGNIGLAAAAYNGGPTRVATWLAGKGGLPYETQDYVQRITGRSPDEWAADARKGIAATDPKPQTCLQIAGDLRAGRGGLSLTATSLAALAPWGVQLSGNFSKSIALNSFERARQRYQAILGDVRPMIIGTRLRTRGFHAFYRVRIPAQTRGEANALCSRIRTARGSCIVLRS